jgi:mannosyltransferase OCH1-like enzyme
MSLTIGASGTNSELFRKYLDNIARKQEIKKLQKTAMLSTGHILRKVLMR